MLREKEAVKEEAEFVIEHLFNAPRHLIWKIFSEADRLAQWWAPAGFQLTVSRFEFSPGGIFHYRMQSDPGLETWGKFVYLQIIEPEKIAFITSFSDEKGRVTRAPMSATWPLEIFNVVSLIETDGKAKLTLKSWPVNATQEEIETFAIGFERMNKEFRRTFNQHDEYLAKLNLSFLKLKSWSLIR
jgi:uncharacterized protein YndB with AHSA1/START domain